MEVHAPHGPVLTLREALVHLAIVTVGILIALSLDGVREWREHRSLAAEARENLFAEIRQNKKELDEKIAATEEVQTNFLNAHSIVQSLIDHQPLDKREMTINFHIAQLNSAAYSTAEITGAFGYMKYEEVRKFAGLYNLQRKYDALQDQFLSRATAATAPAFLLDDVAKADASELQDWKATLEQALAALMFQTQIAQQLSAGYGEVLTGESH